MKTVLGLAVLALSVQASAADKWKTVKADLSSKNYENKVSYPVLTKNSLPGYAKINQQIKDIAESNCDAEEAKTADQPYTSDSWSRIVAFNNKYVGVETRWDNFCGGAYPDYGVTYWTFDSQTGDITSTDTEVPSLALPTYPDSPDLVAPAEPNQPAPGDTAAQAQYKKDLEQYKKDLAAYEEGKKAADAAQKKYDEAYAAYQASQNELAAIIYKTMKAQHYVPDTEECYTKGSQQDIINQIATYSPTIDGLAAKGKVILGINPPHAAGVCAAEFRVDYKTVKKFISPKGKWASWLE